MLKSRCPAGVRRPVRVGTAAVEFALTLPLLVLLTAMIVDFARVFHTIQVLTTAADNGAAHASGLACDPTSADPGRQAACEASEALSPPLRADQVAISSAGETVTVTVTYDHPMITGFLFPNGTFALERTVTRVKKRKVGE